MEREQSIDAVLVRGHGIASGRAADSPYPDGSLRMQAPHFARRGLDLTPYRLATLNLSVAPRRLELVDPEYRFRQVAWTASVTEDFSFSVCAVEYLGRRYRGLVYFPHPETKPDHFQPPTLVEVIAEPIAAIKPGARLVLHYDPLRIRFRPVDSPN